MSYAVISLGGKQYRVSEGQRLFVDRLPYEEGATFSPTILLAGGNGETNLSPDDVVVTARVVGHGLGPKVRIFKYKAKSGYRRTTGHRSKQSQIRIESIGAARPAKQSRSKAAAEPAAEEGA